MKNRSEEKRGKLSERVARYRATISVDDVTLGSTSTILLADYLFLLLTAYVGARDRIVLKSRCRDEQTTRPRRSIVGMKDSFFRGEVFLVDLIHMQCQAAREKYRFSKRLVESATVICNVQLASVATWRKY